MSPITRSWVALASIGAGLIYLALVPGATLTVGALLAAFGVAGFAWGILVLFDPRFLAPRTAMLVALVPIASWIAALLTRTADQGFTTAPLVVATGLELFIAAAMALHLRRGVRGTAPSTRRYAVGVAVGILVVGGAVVPALLAADDEVPAPAIEDGVHH